MRIPIIASHTLSYSRKMGCPGTPGFDSIDGDRRVDSDSHRPGDGSLLCLASLVCGTFWTTFAHTFVNHWRTHNHFYDYYLLQTYYSVID